MAVFLRETSDSRELHYGAQGGGEVLRFFGWGTMDQVEMYLFAQANTPPIFDGFIRNDIRVSPLGGPNWKVEVEYGTTGQGGGDQPTGTSPSQPSGPEDPNTTPLGGGYSFTVGAPKIRFTQSRATISATKRGGGVAIDYKGAIGVDKDGKVEGCDFPPEPRITWKRTVARPHVSQGYIATLAATAGRPNNATFYHFDAGSVLYLGADGQYTQADGWSITHHFGVEENEIDIAICEGLVVPAKKGWEYLWVAYEEIREGDSVATVPAAAYVEELVRPANFALLGIGT
jgi:hypothetical protein